MLTDPQRSMGLAAVLLLGYLVLLALVWSTSARGALQHVDDGFLSLMERLRWGPMVTVAKVLALLGGVVVTIIVRIAVVGVLVRRRHWVHLTAFLLAVATSEALIGTTKALIGRPRPAHGLIHVSSASFPSGHAVAGAVTAVGVVIALLPAGHTRWKWERRAALYASLMALSRTYLGAHWLSDVVGGALLGSAIAIGWPAVLVLRRGGRASEAVAAQRPGAPASGGGRRWASPRRTRPRR